MENKTICTILVISIALVIVVSGITVGSSTTISVPTTYPTIQEAVGQAIAGDTIVVLSGVYTGSVKIDEQLNLTGIGLPELKSASGGTVMEIEANHCLVQGFKISGSTGEYDGIKVTSSHNRILNNTFDNNKIGLGITTSTNNTIRGNTFRGNVTKTGDSVTYGPSISLGKVHNNTISNNAGLGSYDYISLGKSQNNTIKNNTDLKIGLGVYLLTSALGPSNNTLIKNNTIANNTAGRAGIELHGFNNTVTGNKITNHSLYGIMLGFAENNTFENNTVLENPWGGINLGDSNNNTFINNTICNNTKNGFSFKGSYNNTFINNTI